MSRNDNRTTVLVAIGTFLGLSLITLIAWALTRPERPVQAATHEHEQTFERITVDDLGKGDFTVIDVRSAEQFKAGHIPGALHIPVARIEGEIPYLPKGKAVVAYCTCPAEESSGEAAMILARSGISAKALQGGLDEWTKRGLPIEAGVQ